MKYLCFIFLIAGFSIACTGSGNRNSRTTPSGPIAVVIDTITDATDSDRIAPGTLTDLRNPAYMRAVADTIRLQLGGALYDAADPADSITVLETYYDRIPSTGYPGLTSTSTTTGRPLPTGGSNPTRCKKDSIRTVKI